MLKSALLMAALPALAAAAGKNDDVAQTIISMEREALERGVKDVDAFVNISDPDVVYFDPFIERRIDGVAALKEYYHRVFKAPTEEFDIELLNPKVQATGDIAVLTFNYRSKGRSTGKIQLWNCTEVYRKTAQGWRIIQTHWSLTKPQLASAQ